MRVKKVEQKVKPQLKISEDFLGLRTAKTNIIVEKLEENIKHRELSAEAQLKRQIKKF